MFAVDLGASRTFAPWRCAERAGKVHQYDAALLPRISSEHTRGLLGTHCHYPLRITGSGLPVLAFIVGAVQKSGLPAIHRQPAPAQRAGIVGRPHAVVMPLDTRHASPLGVFSIPRPRSTTLCILAVWANHRPHSRQPR